MNKVEEKILVLDRTTNTNEVADLVKCSNCGRLMLIDLGAEICPECEEDGVLMWENENQEVTTEWLGNNGYMLVDVE